MQIQGIKENNTTNFGMKNTFLNKAKNARGIVERRYWESLHNEAKARLQYKKFQKAEKELAKVDEDDSATFFKILSKMAYRKILSGIYSGRAYDKFPNRYLKPDNIANAFSPNKRHYKIKY